MITCLLPTFATHKSKSDESISKKVIRILLVSVAWPVISRAQLRPIPFDKIEMTATSLTAHFYVLTGSPGLDPGHPEAAGGRVGVLVGPDGIFMVDASYAPLSQKIMNAMKKLSDQPIRFLVNTHEHPDHTGGNPNFVRLGAVLLAREEVRQALVKPLPPALATAIGSAALNDDPARLPVLTYRQPSWLRVYFDGETIDIIPVVTSHTDGDSMIFFEGEDVIMIGDFYRNYGYPFVDPAHGGSFKGVVAAIDTLMRVAGPHTQLVPGHGTVIDRLALAPYRAMIVDIQSKVSGMIANGKTKREVLDAKLTAAYDAKVPGGTEPLPANLGTSADRFIGTLYDELKY